MADEWGPIIAHNGGRIDLPDDTEVKPYWSAMGEGTAQRVHYLRRSAVDVDSGPRGYLIAYRVKREPVVETVRRRIGISPVNGNLIFAPTNTQDHGFLVYETRDGIPDMTTLRWEDADNG